MPKSFESYSLEKISNARKLKNNSGKGVKNFFLRRNWFYDVFDSNIGREKAIEGRVN